MTDIYGPNRGTYVVQTSPPPANVGDGEDGATGASSGTTVNTGSGNAVL